MLTRRNFLLSAAAITASSAIRPLRAATPSTAPASQPLTPDTQPVPTTPAARALRDAVGPAAYAELLARLQLTNNNIRTRGLKSIRNVPGVKFLTGYPYNEFYDWDLYLENLYLSHFGISDYCFTNLKEFLARQDPDGYVNRSLIKRRDRQHFKPFLAQLALLGSKQTNDYSWLLTSPEKPASPDNGTYYNRLKKFLDKWFSYDGDNNGLPVWNSADAAGTDNQWSRAGQLAAFEVEGVDLASFLIRDLQAMAVIATNLHLPNDAAAFSAHADALIKKINDTFWDDTDGFYYDRNEKKNTLVKVKSATSFLPLFAGAATPDRAKRIVNEHLLNEKEFWLPYPVASYAKTEPDYYQGTRLLPNGSHECNWRGPSWAPTNYMIFEGLERYGFHDAAKDLAARLFDMAINKNPVLREYYNAETGEGLGQTQFWGFTALYYLLPLDHLIHYDASSLTAPARAPATEELGIPFNRTSSVSAGT